MSLGLTLTIHAPPLDTAALDAFLDQLPPPPADRVRVEVHPPHVTLAFRWSDTPCGYGAAVGTWLLERHRCSGQDLDWGTPLPDNAACTAHLARVSGVQPATPERVHAALAPHLLGAHVSHLAADGEGFIATLTRDDVVVDRLWLCRTWAQVTLHDWPEPPVTEPGLPDRFVLGVLYDLLDAGYLAPSHLDVGWRVPLSLAWSDGRRLVVDAAPDAPAGSPIWSVLDPAGQAVVLTHADEGPRLCRRDAAP